MMDFFDKVAAALTGKRAPNAPDLKRLVEAARAEVDAATNRLSDLKSRRPEVIALGGEVGRVEMRKEMREAEDNLADATEALALLEQRLAAKVEADAEARRVKAYEQAQTGRDAVAARFVRDYERLASEIVDLIRATAEADDAVERANKDRPASFGDLASVETVARAGGGRPRRVLSDTIVELWAMAGDESRPAPDNLQAQIEDVGGGRGILRQQQIATSSDPHRAIGTGRVVHEHLVHYVRRSFRRVEAVEGVSPIFPDPLVRIDLPGLRGGDTAFWEPLNFWNGSSAALEQLGRLAAERDTKSPVPAETRVVTFSPVPDDPSDAEGEAA